MKSHCALCNRELPHNGWNYESEHEYLNGDRVCSQACGVQYDIRELDDLERARMRRMIAALHVVAEESDGMLVKLRTILGYADVTFPESLGTDVNQLFCELDELGATRGAR